MDWGLVLSNKGVASVGQGEEIAEFKAKALNLLVSLCSNPHLMRRGS